MQAQFPMNQQPTPQQLLQLQQHYQQFPQQQQQQQHQYGVQQQQLPQLPSQQMPQQPQIQQLPPPPQQQPQQQQQQQQQQNKRANQAELVQDLFKRYPDQMNNLTRKHSGNQQALLAELAVLLRSGQMGNPLAQQHQLQQQQQPLQQQQQQQMQQQQQQLMQHQKPPQQQPQPPHVVGINGPPSFPQQQQMGMRQPSQGHQRIPSNMSEMSNAQNNQAQAAGGMPNFDAKQFEAVCLCVTVPFRSR